MSQCCYTPRVRIEKIRQNYQGEAQENSYEDVVSTPYIQQISGVNYTSQNTQETNKTNSNFSEKNATKLLQDILPYVEMVEIIPPSQYTYPTTPTTQPTDTTEPPMVAPLPPPGTPQIFPDQPYIKVPPNPLVPEEYQEYVDYSSIQYLNGFMRTQIGKFVKIEQLIGSSQISYKYGYLVGMGINYALLQDPNTKNIVAIDFYNIKSVEYYSTGSLNITV